MSPIKRAIDSSITLRNKRDLIIDFVNRVPLEFLVRRRHKTHRHLDSGLAAAARDDDGPDAKGRHLG